MIQIQDVVIGPMTPLHLPQVLEIERASYPDPWTQATFMRELNASKIAVTIVAHQAVAFAESHESSVRPGVVTVFFFG